MDRNQLVSLTYWTGTDSCVKHPDVAAYDYPTYTDALAALTKKLRERMTQEFPQAKWIAEPAKIYNTFPGAKEYLYSVSMSRADRNELMPHMLSQELGGTEFVDTPAMFDVAGLGMILTRDRVGTSQRSHAREDENRLYAAKAAINGAWYNSDQQFGDDGLGPMDMPDFMSIGDVYPRLKLIRAIPGWDNLRGIPLTRRSWNGMATNPIYQSRQRAGDPNPTSYFDASVMYSRHWKTPNKLFAVFTSASGGTILLNPGESVAPASVYCANGFFEEDTTRSCSTHLTIGASGITLNSANSGPIPVDPQNGQGKGLGYIMTVVP